MLRKCLACGADLPPSATKPKTFCDNTCRMAYRHKNIKEREEHQQRGQRERRNEWYSPPEVVDAARRVMGAIDLDPASCVLANAEIVQATDYYDKSADGLSRAWRGRVWLNPPYDTFAPKFFAKFCEEYAAQRVTMGCLLLGVHHLTTKWFQRVEGFTSILCLPAGRLKFRGQFAGGNQPMHGSAILGVGVNPDLFRREFAEIGMILEMHAQRPAVPAPAPLVLVSNQG